VNSRPGNLTGQVETCRGDDRAVRGARDLSKKIHCRRRRGGSSNGRPRSTSMVDQASTRSPHEVLRRVGGVRGRTEGKLGGRRRVPGECARTGKGPHRTTVNSMGVQHSPNGAQHRRGTTAVAKHRRSVGEDHGPFAVGRGVEFGRKTLKTRWSISSTRSARRGHHAGGGHGKFGTEGETTWAVRRKLKGVAGTWKDLTGFRETSMAGKPHPDRCGKTSPRVRPRSRTERTCCKKIHPAEAFPPSEDPAEKTRSTNTGWSDPAPKNVSCPAGHGVGGRGRYRGTIGGPRPRSRACQGTWDGF